MMSANISEKLVIVGGCGHVGLPLGIIFANHGVDVTLLDCDRTKVDMVNRGKMPFLENNAQAQLERVLGGRLHATTNQDCLREAGVVVTVLGTPVDEHLNPTVTQLHRAIDQTVEAMRDGALLVLRSTVYPGVSRTVYDRICASRRRISLAFCPERIAEGKALEEIQVLPQIISAFDQESRERARRLFSLINDDLIDLEPLEAELAKLFTNSWRYMNFAISNQFYMLAESYGLDFQRIYGAITLRYPRMAHFAKPGFAAGPCLLKDTLQLSSFSGNRFFLGHAAMLVNEGLPNFILEQLRRQGLRGKTAAILGMAFKAGSDDPRESLSYKLRKLLILEAKEVLCCDPYVADDHLTPVEEAIRRAEIVILGAPHDAYRQLTIPAEKEVVDVWGVWPRRS